MICKAAKETGYIWSCESSCPYMFTCEIPKVIKEHKSITEKWRTSYGYERDALDATSEILSLYREYLRHDGSCGKYSAVKLGECLEKIKKADGEINQ